MVDWVEGAKVVAQIGGAIGIGVLAKLYHNRVIAKKDVELERKAAELDGIRSELKKAEARADDAEQLRKTRGHEDLAELRKQMEPNSNALPNRYLRAPPRCTCRFTAKATNLRKRRAGLPLSRCTTPTPTPPRRCVISR